MGLLALVPHLAASLEFAQSSDPDNRIPMIGIFLHPSDSISRDSEDNTPASGHVWLIQELVCEICTWLLVSLLHLWGLFLGDIECIFGIDDDWNAKGCSLWIFLRCLTGPLAKKINYIYIYIYGTITHSITI